MTERWVVGDPGSKGTKLSKSDSAEKLAERNKSYEKVLDLQIEYIRARQEGLFDKQPTALYRWEQKARWHEETYGW